MTGTRGYLASQRRRVRGTLLQLAAIGLGLPLLVVLTAPVAVDNLLHGPFVMDGASLGRTPVPRSRRERPPRHFVRVQTGALQQPFASTAVRSPAEPDDGRRKYHALTQLDGRALVVTYRSDGGDDRAVQPGPEAGARVWRVGNLEPLDDWVRRRLQAAYPQLGPGSILPWVLSTGTRYQGGMWVLAGLLGLLAATGTAALALGLRTALASRWPARLSEDEARQIDEEAADPGAVAAGTSLLTRSYLLYARTFGLEVVPLTELVPRADRLDHEQRWMGVVPLRRDHWVVLGTRQGRRLTIATRRYGADLFIEELERRVALAGGGSVTSGPGPLRVRGCS